jgi:hypothetical protein
MKLRSSSTRTDHSKRLSADEYLVSLLGNSRSKSLGTSREQMAQSSVFGGDHPFSGANRAKLVPAWTHNLRGVSTAPPHPTS